MALILKSQGSELVCALITLTEKYLIQKITTDG